ncbi:MULTISPECIES: GntR family transcriptional regulator [unclassified Achromobacter]|uniref:GntR family transcriptional regulator n=1 Tax=unclassified Achromobacter TaxID=2626865 RepID=UPI000B51DCC6|nr:MULTISPECIES: GntR family transcriptional regulator [unclassified Achromobacter]OWT77098.1 GntR family transcriptional regulator [Achromobacter sp. HZ28]OWT77979.1 GntR family transcriptional regulator [Achromobacter sp. HZ34]
MTDKTDLTMVRDDSTGPLADQVFQRILDAIYQGHLAPGAVINEMALAQEFGVSRGPVREAVRRLQGIQLVTREPYVKARVMTLTAESALELFQMRMALEGVACNLAARRMSDADVEDLLRELELDKARRRNQGKDGRASKSERGSGNESTDGAASPAVFDFHERIVRASGNNRIIHALCEDLYHLLRVYRRHSGTVLERKDDAYDEHWQIARAIRARDGDLAESLMRSHIERAARHLFSHLAEDVSGPPGRAAVGLRES